MDKLDPKTDGASADITAENIQALKVLFPECVTEGKIDFDVLRELLGSEAEDRPERYSFNWNGKSRARRIAQTPSTGTLRPCPEESVNWDTTQNIFIEGDNLEALKLLQKSYHKRVKMIYIDPPYNKGKDFIYPDRFQDNLDTYLRFTGQRDLGGFPLSQNAESSGRFHTNWLNMIYPRLKLARNVLTDDGVIFVSIDNKEAHNLRKVLDEIFGPENYVAQFTWRTDGNFDNQAKIKSCHEYIMMYARSLDSFPAPPAIDPAVPKDSKLYNDTIRNTIVKNGPKNPVSRIVLPAGFPSDIESGIVEARTDSWPHYALEAAFRDGVLVSPAAVESGWSSKELLEEFIANDCQPIRDSKGQVTRFVISATGGIEAIKERSEYQSHVISVISGVGGPQKATAELATLGVAFDDYPKPTALIEYFVQMNYGDDFVVLDFFAGSCTTAHAVLNVNKKLGGTRRFITVQLPEPCDPSTNAFKSGFRNIAEIGKERIRRSLAEVARTELSVDAPSDGMRVFKLDASNLKSWDADFDTLEPSLLDAVENIKPDRTERDILYELLLKYGLDLAVPVEERVIEGKKVHVVGDGALIVCLADGITLAVVEGIAALKVELQPEITRVVFKDSGFPNDVVKTNTVQVLRQAGIDDVKSL